MRYRVNVSPGGLGSSPAKDAGIPGLNLDNTFTSGMPGFYIDGNGGAQLGYALGVNQCNCPLAQREQQGRLFDKPPFVEFTDRGGGKMAFAGAVTTKHDKETALHFAE